MKRIVIVIGILLTLVGCKEGGEELGMIGEDTFTETDYIETVVGGLDEETLQVMYVDKVLEEYSDKETEDAIYKDYIKDYENTSEEEIDEETKDEFKRIARQDAGTVNVLKEVGYVTEKEIDKKYEESKYAYGVNVSVIEGDKVDAEKVREIMKDSDNAEKEVNSLGEEVEYFEDYIYTDFSTPEGFPTLKGTEEEDIIIQKNEEEGITYVLEVVTKEEVKQEEIEYDIILNLGNDVVGTVDELILVLEDKGLITMNKDLREYLGIDRNRAE